jgi:hypothetical protein
MYNILRLGPDFYKLTSRSLDYVYPLTHIFTSPFDPFLVFVNRIIQWLWLLGPSIFLILLVLSLMSIEKTRLKTFTVLVIWTFVPILISAEYAKVLTARYVLIALPTLSIMAAGIFLNVQFKRILTFMLFLFVGHALIIDILFVNKIEGAPLPSTERSGYLEDWTSGYGIKEVASYLQNYQNTHPNEKLVVGTEGHFGTLPDGLQLYMTNYPQITIIGVGIDLDTLPQSLIDSRKFGNKTFLIINSSRLLIKPSARKGLVEIAAFPKANRQPGTRDYNLLGPRDELLLIEVTQEAVKK